MLASLCCSYQQIWPTDSLSCPRPICHQINSNQSLSVKSNIALLIYSPLLCILNISIFSIKNVLSRPESSFPQAISIRLAGMISDLISAGAPRLIYLFFSRILSFHFSFLFLSLSFYWNIRLEILNDTFCFMRWKRGLKGF